LHVGITTETSGSVGTIRSSLLSSTILRDRTWRNHHNGSPFFSRLLKKNSFSLVSPDHHMVVRISSQYSSRRLISGQNQVIIRAVLAAVQLRYPRRSSSWSCRDPPDKTGAAVFQRLLPPPAWREACQKVLSMKMGAGEADFAHCTYASIFLLLALAYAPPFLDGAITFIIGARLKNLFSLHRLSAAETLRDIPSGFWTRLGWRYSMFPTDPFSNCHKQWRRSPDRPTVTFSGRKDWRKNGKRDVIH